MTAHHIAVDHLLLRLRPIQRALRKAVAKQSAAAARLDSPELAPMCVTDQQVAHLLHDVERSSDEWSDNVNEYALTDEESAYEDELRRAMAACGNRLPLDEFVESVGLSFIEMESLVLCAAIEVDRRYERIFAYVQDDLHMLYPTVDLVAGLTSRGMHDRLRRRAIVGPYGLLRQRALIEVFGESTTESRRSLRLGPGVFEFLTGNGAIPWEFWRDPIDDTLVTNISAPRSFDSVRATKIGAAIAGNAVNLVGLWGQSADAIDDAASLLSHAAGKTLIPLRVAELTQAGPSARDQIREQLRAVAVQGAIWRLNPDEFSDPAHQFIASAIVQSLAVCRVPCLLTGRDAWRPTDLLAARRYVELDVGSAGFEDRRGYWDEAIPSAESEKLDDLASRFRMSRKEVAAAVAMAQAHWSIDDEGPSPALDRQLDVACASVARKVSGRFTTLVRPRRGPDDLILPPAIQRQVMEIARFSLALPQVVERWKFDRLATGGGGMKALFTGEPGTGKSLAAEVISGILRVPMLKVDIGQTVSKWIGETEKHLDEAFREASASHAVLFIDEADALCGKRGDVNHGTDRYANIEVGYLLQRLEEHDGIVILASNLKENIDPAFLRRFHSLVHFPRPSPAERRRLWLLAFPKESPRDPSIDFDKLARLDLTGAGIVSSARTAALIAADEKSTSISLHHIAEGVVRQYRREGRVLAPAELSWISSSNGVEQNGHGRHQNR